MRKYLIFVFFCSIFVHSVISFGKTLSGNPDSFQKKSLIINADDDYSRSFDSSRRKRDTGSNVTNSVNVKITRLDDRHKTLMVHWVSDGSEIIVCLARDPSPPSDIAHEIPSAVYISYNYGDTFDNKTDSFKLADGNYSTLDKFYNHQKINRFFIFSDVKHKTIFVTSDYGHNIKRLKLDFSPSEISFHEYKPYTFLVHDKSSPEQLLYLTEDFGESFQKVREFVKSFHWMKGSNGDQHLIEYRMEPSGLGTILHSNSMFKVPPASIYSLQVKDLFIKSDYIFTTKEGEKGNMDLYVSHKFGPQIKCLFDTQLDRRSYFVVDVTGNRALVAVSHGRTISHLYVSDNLGGTNDIVEFTLSLEDVLCYFPNNTWHDTLMQLMSEETFADVYKVEGLTGIYIASKIVHKPNGNNLGPQNLGSVITFDHGSTWRLIQAPQRDNEGQLISCDIHQNCSLHLSQKFSYLYPDTKTISILSSKSAPGMLVATGIIGNSLKGHYGVYVSSDAGWTWRQALKDLYFFNMGDHGAILTAVKYYKSRGETRHILYSTDEGETWMQTPFNKENLRLYGLMTEPGENTTVFTMFGSGPEFHQWVIVKLDMMKSFHHKCTPDDYKIWSPSQSESTRSYVPCIMGQQRTYQRKMAHVNCYNGLDYDAPISMKPCNCDILDYECDFGFVHDRKFGQCIRNKTVLIDPYKVPKICPPGQFYNRTKGYRKIAGDQCVSGFEKHYLPDRVPCPFKEVQDFLLFAQRERISRFNLVTKTLEELPVSNLKNVIAIDFDMKNNCVFWADIALDIIGRQCLSNGSVPEILVSNDLASIEGMAFDWISNTLYFVDGMRSKIELIRTDIQHSGRMRKTILGQDVLKKPRGIALHPKHGYMFWTDWSAENPSVNRADLDGTNIKPLFKKPVVEWPNGISIDYFAERIYWVDARQDYIASADLHGDDMKYVIKHNEVVSHPFAVAVFKNSMFWDDWKRIAIFSADKDSSNGNLMDLEVLQKQLVGLMDLKVFAHGIQIGNNTCSPTTCPYLCVASPSQKGHSCLCPDGMIRTKNDCLCPGNVKPTVNGTCPKLSGTCSSEHFTCDDNSCIPYGWKCDGEPDCGDGSDEVNCKTESCPPYSFVCGDGKCIPHFWKCDYSNDCADGSDELNCPKSKCAKDKFTCNNGRCIALKWKCDGENDCRDNSDELNCSSPEPTICKHDEFHCKSGGTICIPNTWRCDKEKDCQDGSDEVDCDVSMCSDDRFFCGAPDNICIYKSWKCDGDIDCPNGRDEQNCSQAIIPHKHKVSDLFNSQNGSCVEWMFKCLNNKCIPFWWKCDDSDDCGDGSDELGCKNEAPTTTSPITAGFTSNPEHKTCAENQFQCSTGSCILSSWLCDGVKDCLEGEDELNCSSTCDAKHFRCRKDGSCIFRELVCDHKKDCPDGTDELNCDIHLPKVPEAPSCAEGFFPCDNGCLPLTYLCNGHLDCSDFHDELYCSKTNRVYQVLQMGMDESETNETSISFYWWLSMPNKINTMVDFMPSINKIGENKWQNMTWTNETHFIFTKLAPFTVYNITVYVRNEKKGIIFPPAKFFNAATREGIPTEPYNVTVKQSDSSSVLISWNKPSIPNGIIISYQIVWGSDPFFRSQSGSRDSSRSIELNEMNITSHNITADFLHNTTYSFFVIASNRRHKSPRSKTASITFDKETTLEKVFFKTGRATNCSIFLSWNYTGIEPEGFHIDVEVSDRAYPKLEPRTTKEHNITINQLSPGVKHLIKIYAYKKHFMGPIHDLVLTTEGKPLPEVLNIHDYVVDATSINLTWSKPNDNRTANWIYGIYYGITPTQLFDKAKIVTSNLSAIVSKLEACETYTFTVGLVSPLGYGPLYHKFVEYSTFSDPKAPPKRLTVGSDNDNPLRMKVQWEPSCLIDETTAYIIRVYEQIGKDVSNFKLIKKKGSNIFYHVFDVSYGGVYDVSVATTALGARFTPNVTYYAPAIPGPYSVRVLVENNGSYFLYWQEREVPQVIGTYHYEVLVSPGNTLDERNAEKFSVDKPPFIYTNFSSTMYTFGVKLVTHKNFSSFMSERVSIANEYKMSVTLTKSSVSTILICVLTLFVVLSAVIGLLFLRHRRLQKSFVRFANSHYDSRSGAATFDDNHGLEDEIPRIQGFSDDEPLVIA